MTLMDPLSAAAEGRALEPSQPSTSGQPPLSRYESRAAQFREIISQEVVNLRQLKALAYDGVPEEKGLRAAVWKARAAQELITRPCKTREAVVQATRFCPPRSCC